MNTLKIILLIIGLLLSLGGAVMLVLTRMFGSSGIMDRYRRNKAGEYFFFAMIVIGVLLIGWGGFK